MTVIARAAFVLLVGATLAAFVVTQHLKRTPPVLLHASARPAFISPNGDGVQDRARIGFEAKRRDEATVSIVDESGDIVRQLGRRIARPHVLIRLSWDGRGDDGLPVADGRYRVRVDLRFEGRSITVPGAIVVDRVPPRVTVVRVRPSPRRGGPVVLPAPRASAVSVRLEGYFSRPPVLLVYRTDVRRPQMVARRPGRPGGGGLKWEGTVRGRPAPTGTYVLAVKARDLAGNVGSAPARLPPVRGEPGAAHLGVTVRYLAVSPPLTPVAPGSAARFRVDTRAGRYAWVVRRVADSRRLAAGTSAGRVLAFGARGRVGAGAYELAVSAGGHRATVPWVVGNRRRERVLIVLPSLSWQGRNAADDDGDGFPDTLLTASSVGLTRPFARTPAGFSRREAPLLSFAVRNHWRFDLTTDLELATGRGPGLGGHRGVVLAGAPEWEPAALGESLRSYVRRGGRVLLLDAGVLRREVSVGHATLERPTPLAPRDALGMRLAGVAHRPVLLAADPLLGAANLLGARDPARLGRFDAFEELLDAGHGAGTIAAADASPRRRVLVAVRMGAGLVIRTGLPEWNERLARSAAAASTTRRMWTLLSR